MFVHSAVMVVSEMRLRLPCDENLWNAASFSELSRLQSLQHGIEPTTFLDDMKKMLNSQPVKTNSFGRTALMAGLLSVSWHLHQRDLLVSSLGVTWAFSGGQSIYQWRKTLSQAFDYWKTDLDQSLSEVIRNNPTFIGQLDENVFENHTVLYYLAQMAINVDFVDCQIFAGASTVLGKTVTTSDYSKAQQRMKERWAPTARARDATFYALRFLSHVLNPEQCAGGYSARDDFLINRPWVMYVATLIVWSYGYASDGSIKPIYRLKNSQVVTDMKGFLKRVGKHVRKPGDLAKLTDRNACLGLLEFMRDTFDKARSQLLHEASDRLQNCIKILTGGQDWTIFEPT
jgi:hypothetical protein